MILTTANSTCSKHEQAEAEHRRPQAVATEAPRKADEKTEVEA